MQEMKKRQDIDKYINKTKRSRKMEVSVDVKKKLKDPNMMGAQIQNMRQNI